MKNTILHGEALNTLRTMKSESINCIITSPPYYGLRDYGEERQLGLEKTPEEYVQKLVDILHEARRVLTDDGTLWLNIGDSYAGSGKNRMGDGTSCATGKQATNKGSTQGLLVKTQDVLPSKNLIGVPWMIAFALRADGWYLRQDIIWAKPNPMPESVKDRCTKSHEYIFLLSKSPKYYFDAAAISEPVAQSTIQRLSQNIEEQDGSSRVPNKTNRKMKAVAPRYGGKKYTAEPDVFNRTKSGGAYEIHENRNKRDVWTVSTQPFDGSHFATFPIRLIEPCVLAGCPSGGIVLDPFFGSGTTGLAARKHNRNYIGIEINLEYVELANKRLSGLFDTDFENQIAMFGEAAE